MKWILALAGMIALTTGCEEAFCSGEVRHSSSWDGREIPRAALIAAGPAASAVVWNDRLSLVSDDTVIAMQPLDFGNLRAIAMAPDGTGILIDGQVRARVFDSLGRTGEPLELETLAASAPSVVFDGTAFSVAWSVGQQVFLARVSTTGALVQRRTLIGLGAPDCGGVGPVVMAALEDHAAWIAWTTGARSQPAIVAAKLVDGALGAPTEIVVPSLLPPCGAGALHGIAASGPDALVHVAQYVVPLAADGTGTPAVDVGTEPVTLVSAPGGFALVPPYERAATASFPRDLYSRIRFLEPDGIESLQIDVRGAGGVFATAYGRFVAATGVDETVEDDGTSTLGVTRIVGDTQGPPVVLGTEALHHSETTKCITDTAPY